MILENKRGCKKEILFLIGIFVIVFFCLNSISATVNITVPRNLTNYTTSITFNVSYNTSSDISAPVNASFYYNYSGTWTLIGAVNCTEAYFSCNGTLGISNLYDGLYNVSVILANASNSVTPRVINSPVRFDSTAPSVLNYNVKLTNGTIGYGNGLNYSGVALYLFNVSVNDSGIGNISSVYFNISYSNGTQINYTAAINVVLTNYTLMVNLTNVSSNAVYYITAYANDTLNNLNKSEIFQITLDNTDPTATFDCSPDSVTPSGTIDCTCTPADNLIGIDNSLTTYTSHPSVSTVGTHTVTCTYGDFAGNTGSSTTTYTILSAGDSSATITTTTTQTPTTEKENIWATIAPETPVIMQDFVDASGINQIQIEVSSVATNVQLIVSEYSSKPSAVSVSQFNSYKYIYVNTLNLANKLEKAIMKIKVEKSWIAEKGIEKENVALFKFDESAERWNALTTTFDSEDATYYYYSIELDSFSYFVIAPLAVSSEETVPVTTGEETTATPTSAWIWIIVTAGLLVIIAVIAIILSKKKRK